MTELSNLCGLAQVRAVKKSCHAALVFSHFAASCPARPFSWSSSAFWSSQCSAGPSLRISGGICNGPVVVPVVWCVVTDWLLFTSPQQRLRPCVRLRPTPCCRCCLVPLAPALRYSPLGDPEPTVRAARARLLGLCCFLPPVPAAFPGALSLLLLLASACFLPPASLFALWVSLPASLPSVLLGVVGSPPFCLVWPLLVFVWFSLCGFSRSALPVLFVAFGRLRLMSAY